MRIALPGFRSVLGAFLFLVPAVFGACSDKAGGAGSGGGPGGGPGGGAGSLGSGGAGGAGVVDSGPGTPVSTPPSAAEQAERDRVAGALGAVAALDGAGLLARYPSGVSASATLGYDPMAAANLSLIETSKVGLSIGEKEVLAKNGFVISDRMRFPGFTYGYQAIYADDLPLFVSADSILYAVHRSYDGILKSLELASLRPSLKSLLEGLRTALASGAISALGPAVEADIDLYLAVPLGLLDGAAPAPVKGASTADIAAFIQAANEASGLLEVSLFGVTRKEDFSQFVPRGHYTDSDALKTYFKAMMWLGRFDQRMIETLEDGSQVFRRRQFDGALGLTQLLASGTNQANWQIIDSVVGAFVGEADSMPPSQFPALLAALGAADLPAVAALPDGQIAAALVAGNFGAQRIASHVMITGVHKQALPLSRTFLLLGQRFVVDSQVFSNVVYDRVPPSKLGRLRMLPDPLDVAFAVFANNQAATLLQPGLDTFEYAPALASMRTLVDDHGDAFWGGNLYNEWLSALRALTPPAGGQSGPLSISSTDGWGRRLLNTQLASWAELRHDSLLYAKQSYSTGVTCSFPDALVEPNPAFWGKLVEFAAKGQAVVGSLGPSTASVTSAASTFFSRLSAAATMLKSMADSQAAGTPFSDEQMAFINQAVKFELGCGGPAGATGWYPQLFFQNFDSTDFHPTIADVHTAPTDEAGADVGNVVHVGTGYARLMVVTANTCDGPKAYAGLASTFSQVVTEHYQRLNDTQWNAQYVGQEPALPWLSGLIAR